MYDNVPAEFQPSHGPEKIFANPDIDYVFNNSDLNFTRQTVGRSAEKGWADRLAVRSLSTDEEITYRELESRVNRFAGGLRELGIQEGDRIFCRFGESPEAIVTQLAAWQIGAIVSPSVLAEGAEEITDLVNDIEATCIVASSRDFEPVEEALPDCPSVSEIITTTADSGHRPFDEVMELGGAESGYADTSPHDAAMILYTGGTTGRPKGCIYTHASILNTADLNGGYGLGLEPGEAMFTPVPVGHGFGNQKKIFTPYRFGATVVLADSPSPPEMLEIIQEHGVNYFSAVPTIFRMMLDKCEPEEYNLSSLQLVAGAGGAFDESTYEEWVERTGIENTCNILGAVEAGGGVISSYRDGEKIAPTLSLGKAFAGYEAKILDIQDLDEEVGRNEPGRLAMRGPTVAPYWQNTHPDIEAKSREQTHNGWLLLDDVFTRDEDGFIHHQARLDDMITSGGRQISPVSVEETLNDHPAVRESAVIGKPDDTRGEIVKAYVVPTPATETSPNLIDELQTYCKEHMAKYKYPREIEFIQELPKTKVGKLDRKELRSGV